MTRAADSASGEFYTPMLAMVFCDQADVQLIRSKSRRRNPYAEGRKIQMGLARCGSCSGEADALRLQDVGSSIHRLWRLDHQDLWGPVKTSV